MYLNITDMENLELLHASTPVLYDLYCRVRTLECTSSWGFDLSSEVWTLFIITIKIIREKDLDMSGPRDK